MCSEQGHLSRRQNSQSIKMQTEAQMCGTSSGHGKCSHSHRAGDYVSSLCGRHTGAAGSIHVSMLPIRRAAATGDASVRELLALSCAGGS